MHQRGKLGAIILAGFMVISGNAWLAKGVQAQSDSKKFTEKEWQELQQKRQEQWNDRVREQQRQENVGQRLKEAEQRQRDAARRQREAEQRLREQQK